MRIERPRRNDRDGWARLEATAIWEEQPKDPVTIFFEVPETYGSFLSDSADCFLASCSTLAALAGEKRLFVANGGSGTPTIWRYQPTRRSQPQSDPPQ